MSLANELARQIIFFELEFKASHLIQRIVPNKSLLTHHMMPIGQIKLAPRNKLIMWCLGQFLGVWGDNIDQAISTGLKMFEGAPQARELFFLSKQVHKRA